MNTELNKTIPAGRWKHIIPPAILVYIVAFMDRTNIGFAVAGGMDKALGITATLSGIAGGIFFIGYLFLQVPGARIAEKGNAKAFITWMMIAWGALSILCGFVENVTQLLIIRFLIGVAEGGVYPAVLTIISHWFPKKELARANSLFQMNIPIASIITGPISGWIVTTYSWRYVFIIEGAIAVFLLFVWLPLISNRPSEAKWISKEEKEYIENKIHEEQEAIRAEEGRVAKQSIGTTLLDRNVWKLITIFFLFNIGVYGFSLWLPTTLKALTGAGMTGVGMLSIVPYVGAIIGLLTCSSLSDRSGNRKLWITIALFGFSACLLLSVMFKNSVWTSYAFLVGVGIFFQAMPGIFWSLPPILFDSDMAANARGIVNALGNLGGFVGPYAVGALTTAYGSSVGTMALVISLALAAFVTMTLPPKTSSKNTESIIVETKDM